MSSSISQELIQELRNEAEKERDAYSNYLRLSSNMEGEGNRGAATTLYHIAKDEKRHHNMLIGLVRLLALQEESHLQRPFPQSYNDWAMLGIDIYVKDKNYTEKVQECLTNIHEELPDADEAKRWLVKKAGELGIT